LSPEGGVNLSIKRSCRKVNMEKISSQKSNVVKKKDPRGESSSED
jgi:hypothetical protein